MNAIAPIFHHARTRPNAPALIEGERAINYCQLADLVSRTSTQLRALGLCFGDRVGLCLKDNVAHVVSLLATSQIGAVPVSLDWRASALENSRFIDGLGLKRVLAEPDARLAVSVPAVVLDDAWHRAIAAAEPGERAGGDWNDPFIISASSGSTGAPKFTQMTHLQYYFAMAGLFEVMNLSGSHRYLCTLPLYYSGGRNSCIAHLLRGDCVILYPSLFAAAEYVELAHRQKVTVGLVVPSVVRQLLAIDHGGPVLSGMSAFFCTGAPLSAEEKRKAARRLTPNFHERYGVAEMLVVSVLRPSDLAERADSVGQPHSLVEIEVVDDDDRTLTAGHIGRLRYRGPGLASPTFGEPSEKNFRNGWHYPGELARLDELSYIFLQGRTTDVIIRSGAKIFPAEIEACLCEHPAVAEAAVIGRRTAEHEEEVVAFVVPRSALSLGDIMVHCRRMLTSHKVPRLFRLVNALPKLTSGKVDKSALARLLEDSAAQLSSVRAPG